MRHRKKGRTLGRSPSHRKAMLRNLASSLILTQRDAEHDENPPKVKGRVITTLHKAKEVRPLVEKCVTIARHSLRAEQDAEQFETNAERGTESWRQWRNSESWQQWNAAIAPAVAARRRALKLLGDKEAVRVLFDEVAVQMADREGGYTRIVRLAKPRLGDGGVRAVLEFVGQHDRKRVRSEKPKFEEADQEEAPPESAEQQSVEDQPAEDQETEPRAVASDEAEEQATDQPGAEEGSSGRPGDPDPEKKDDS